MKRIATILLIIFLSINLFAQSWNETKQRYTGDTLRPRIDYFWLAGDLKFKYSAGALRWGSYYLNNSGVHLRWNTDTVATRAYARTVGSGGAGHNSSGGLGSIQISDGAGGFSSVYGFNTNSQGGINLDPNYNNVHIGNGAGEDHSTAYSNTFVGAGSGRHTTSGIHNSFYGDSSGLNNFSV